MEEQTQFARQLHDKFHGSYPKETEEYLGLADKDYWFNFLSFDEVVEDFKDFVECETGKPMKVTVAPKTKTCKHSEKDCVNAFTVFAAESKNRSGNAYQAWKKANPEITKDFPAFHTIERVLGRWPGSKKAS